MVSFRLLSTTVKKKNSDESSQGFTVVVDGQLKELFDEMIKLDGENYPDYGNIIAKCLSKGVAESYNSLKNK